MSKPILVAYSEVDGLVVDDSMWDHSKQDWDKKEQLQRYVDDVVSERPPVVDDFSERVVRNVMSEDGRRGTGTWVTVFSGVPHLSYDAKHVDDIVWIYPVISKRKLAGPSWA